MSFFKFGRSAAAPVDTKEKAEKESAEPQVFSPITVPPAGIAVPAHAYTAEQESMITALREYTATIVLPETDEYYPWEARFLADPGTHPRYMRAAKWHLQDAKKRIKGTLEWRREYRPELIEPAEVAPEQESGKLVLSGFDKDGRPLLYMFPSRQNTKESPRQLRHTVYFLERAIDLMPPNQEHVALVIDYRHMSNGQQPSLSTGRQVLNVLQNHYVERLGRAFVLNVPWWLNAFFTAVSPFIDPIRFNPDLTEFVELGQLDKAVGGQYNFKYDFEKYWPELNEFCHMSPEGARVDDNGKPWVPPAGMGIKYAVDMMEKEKAAVPPAKVDEPAATEIKLDESAAPAVQVDEPSATALKLDEQAAPAVQVDEPVAPTAKVEEPAAPPTQVDEPAAPAAKVDEPAAPAVKANEPAAPTA